MKAKIEMVSVSLPAKLVKQIERIRKDSSNSDGKRNNTMEKFIVFTLVDIVAAWDEPDGKRQLQHHFQEPGYVSG